MDESLVLGLVPKMDESSDQGLASKMDESLVLDLVPKMDESSDQGLASRKARN